MIHNRVYTCCLTPRSTRSIQYVEFTLGKSLKRFDTWKCGNLKILFHQYYTEDISNDYLFLKARIERKKMDSFLFFGRAKMIETSRFYSDSIDDSRGNFGGVKICIWV